MSEHHTLHVRTSGGTDWVLSHPVDETPEDLPCRVLTQLEAIVGGLGPGEYRVEDHDTFLRITQV